MTKDLSRSELSKLADEINDAHGKVAAAFSDAVEHAVRAGTFLAEAKQKVAHGGWLPWLKENFAFSERTAQGYMRVARELPKLKAQRVADLSFRQTIALLQQPKPVEIHPINEMIPHLKPHVFERLDYCSEFNRPAKSVAYFRPP